MPVVAQPDDDAVTAVARTYREFARLEAQGRSAAYEALADSVAGDARAGGLHRVAAAGQAPAEPAVRGGPLPARRPARDRVATRAGQPVPGRTDRADPGPADADQRAARCAVLLPALAQLPQPLALIEAGASAGLNLLVDRYSYDYAGHRLAGLDPDAPVLRCEPRGPVPLPARIPAISWRAGLDLNPLDVTREDDVRWLSCLVWPGEGDRAQRLAAAIASARRDPPAVHRGDMLTGLPSLAAQAPADATLVIYHTSALWYLPAERREQFAGTVRGLGATWLSSEPPGVVPGTDGPARDGHTCVLARDGHGHRPDREPRDVAAMAALIRERRR